MTEKTNSDSITLSFVGQSLIKENIIAGQSPEMLDIATLIRENDVSFTGYEGTIRGSYGGWPMKSTFLHVSDPLVFDCLKTIGFNLLSLSNNHTFDLGPGGVLSTLEEAKARGFTVAGIGKDLKSASEAGILKSNGKHVALIAMDAGPQGEHVYATNANEKMAARPGSNRLRVNTTIVVKEDDLARIKSISEQLGHEQSKQADNKVGFKQVAGEGYQFFGLRFAAATEYEERRWADLEDGERNLKTISSASAKGAFVIVYIHHHHWEPRWELVPKWFQSFAHQCVDAGAKVVVSHGVPMLQGMEIYKGAALLYGLGNFIFHTFQPQKYIDDRIWQSVIARTSFKNGVVDRIDLHPIALGGQAAIENQNYTARRIPHIARGAYGENILRRLAEMSRAFGTHVEIENGRGVIRPTISP